MYVCCVTKIPLASYVIKYPSEVYESHVEHRQTSNEIYGKWQSDTKEKLRDLDNASSLMIKYPKAMWNTGPLMKFMENCKE